MRRIVPLIIGGILLGVVANHADCSAASEYDQEENVYRREPT
jgi:hypothetical protein